MRLHARLASIAAWTIALLAAPTPALAQDGCLADLNDDGLVNGTDLAIVLGGWGPCPVNTTFVGGVVKAGGSPVVGATVTTDLGGETVSGEGGIFLLQIELPSVIETVTLSATAEINGVSFEGTKTVSPVTVGGNNLVGLIEVSSGGCDTGFAWLPTFAGSQGLSPGFARAFATFDDGSGPSLYIAGSSIQQAGGIPVSNIARWDGVQFSPLGVGVSGDVYSLAVFDSGNGPELIVGGGFSNAGEQSGTAHIARWNGESWSSVGEGVGGAVLAMCVFDDGSGPALYVGGAFQTAGGNAAYNVARWDGLSWTPLGGGLLGVSSSVYSLCVFEDAEGSRLVAGGTFVQAGDVQVANIAMWDGTHWSPVGSGLGTANDGSVLAVSSFDDGHGPALIAGGTFSTAGKTEAMRIARWSDGTWSTVGGGVSGGSVTHLLTWNDGFTTDLYVAGSFTSAGGLPARRIARWNGAEWSMLGTGADDSVAGLGSDSDSLFLGGSFEFVDGIPARGIAQWGCTAP